MSKFDLQSTLSLIKDTDFMSKGWFIMARNVTILSTKLLAEKDAASLTDAPMLMSVLRQKKFYTIVHLLQRYREDMKDATKREKGIENAKKHLDCDEAKVLANLRAYEINCGTMISQSLKFLMLAQRVNFDDVFLLCASMLRDCINGQEEAKKHLIAGVDLTCFIALKILHRITHHISEFEEDRMIEPILKEKIVPLVLQVLQKNKKTIRAYAAAAGIVFLDLVMDSEAFLTDAGKFIESKEVKQDLVDVQKYLAVPMLKMGMLKKKPRQVQKWANKYQKQLGSNTTDEELAKAVEAQLSLTSKMKDTSGRSEGKTASKKKKKSSIIF